MNTFLTTFHIIGIMFWMIGLSGYILVKMQFGTREEELNRAIQRRKFDMFSLGGIVIWFSTGMAMIVSFGYIGSGEVPIWLGIKFLLILIMFLTSLSVVGMDFGLVKILREMKTNEPETVRKRTEKLSKAINLMALISFLLSLIIFLFVRFRNSAG